MKTLKKFIAALALVATVLGPNAALATSVSTTLSRGTAGGNAPETLVKWEMSGTVADMSGTDDNPAAGAQFLPSATYGVDKKFAVCGIVADVDGVTLNSNNIDSVYGDIWYPEEIYLGTNHEDSRQGCGQDLGTECRMTRVEKMAGIDLFCNKIRNTNNGNLPTFLDSQVKGWDYLCKADGELQKETAYVACCDRTLSYEDPAGNYETIVFAQDKDLNNSNLLENEFTYKPVTAFEADFNAVAYGAVRLNTEKVINGDLTWDTLNAGKPSVRNIGNTRMKLTINQDDMGLGMTGTTYNVKYMGRVGNVASDWSSWYAPLATKQLNDALDLSELDEVDFGILISKFPPLGGNDYSGSMTLGAVSATALDCTGRTSLDVSPR